MIPHRSLVRALMVLGAAAVWLVLLAAAGSADTCSTKERSADHCANTAWVPGVTLVGGGTATTITIIRRIPGKHGGTTTFVTKKGGTTTWFRPKFKPPRRKPGDPGSWDPTTDAQRKKWNEDGEIWDPVERRFRPPRPDELEEHPWEPPITKSMPRDKVPQSCRDLYDAYVSKQEEQHWLDLTRKELEQRLERAERLFFNNKIKAQAQIGIDITAAGAGVGSGVASGVRAGVKGSGVGGGVARALGAGEQLDELIKQRTSMLKGLDDTVEVSNAKQMQEYWGNKAKTAEVDLPKADAARRRYADTEAARQNLSQQMAPDIEFRSGLEKTKIRGKAEIEGLTEAMNHRLRGLEDVPGPKRQLDALEAKIKSMERRAQGTLGGPGGQPKSAMDRAAQQAAQEELARLHQLAEDLHGEIRSITNDYQAKIGKVQEQIKDATQKLNEHNKEKFAAMKKDANRLQKQSQDALTELHQLEDVTAAELAKYQNAANQATRELGEARKAARAKIQGDLDRIDAEMQDIKNKLVKLNEPQNPSLPTRVVETLLGPLIAGWEKLFGSGNSPKEMIEILLKNKQAIADANADLVRLKAEQEVMSKMLQKAKQALDACIAANQTPAAPVGGAPMQ